MKKILTFAYVLLSIVISTNADADTIYLRNGKSAKIEVIEIQKSHTSIRKENGTEFQIPNEDILKIVYSNGDVALFNKEESRESIQLSSFHSTSRLTDEKTIMVEKRPDVALKTSNRALVEGLTYELFYVTKASDMSLIGCPVVCEILQRRKSNIYGSEGRLAIRPLYIVDKEGKPRYLLPTDIHRRGKNFTNGKFWLSLVFFPAIFVAGTKAEIEDGEVLYLRLE